MSNQDEELTDVTLELVHETDRAYLLTDGKIEEWVPKAVVQNNEDGTWTMPARVAIRKGFA